MWINPVVAVQSLKLEKLPVIINGVPISTPTFRVMLRGTLKVAGCRGRGDWETSISHLLSKHRWKYMLSTDYFACVFLARYLICSEVYQKINLSFLICKMARAIETLVNDCRSYMFNIFFWTKMSWIWIIKLNGNSVIVRNKTLSNGLSLKFPFFHRN